MSTPITPEERARLRALPLLRDYDRVPLADLETAWRQLPTLLDALDEAEREVERRRSVAFEAEAWLIATREERDEARAQVERLVAVRVVDAACVEKIRAQLAAAEARAATAREEGFKAGADAMREALASKFSCWTGAVISGRMIREIRVIPTPEAT